LTGGLPDKLTTIEKATGAAIDAQQMLVGEENELKAQLAVKQAERDKTLAEGEQKTAEAQQNLWNNLTSEVEDKERELKEFDYDPKRVFNNASTGGKIAMALALFMGGYNQSKTGGRNLALETFNNMVTNDMASQREEFAALRVNVENSKASRAEKMGALNELNKKEAVAEALKWTAITGQIQGAIDITQNAQKIPELELLQQATNEKRAEVLANYTQRAFGALEQVRSNMAQEANARYAIEARAATAASKGKGGGSGSGPGKGGEYDPNQAFNAEQIRRKDAGLPLLTPKQQEKFVTVQLLGADGKPRTGFVLSDKIPGGQKLEFTKDIVNATNLMRNGADLARKLQTRDGVFRFDERGYPLGFTEEGARLASDYSAVLTGMIKHNNMGASFTKNEQEILELAIGGNPTAIKQLAAKAQGGQLLHSMRRINRDTTAWINTLSGEKLKIMADSELADAAPPGPPPKHSDLAKAAQKGDSGAIAEIKTRYETGTGIGAIRDVSAYQKALEMNKTVRDVGAQGKGAHEAVRGALLAYEDKVKDAALKSLVKGGEAAKIIAEMGKHKGLDNPERIKLVEKLAGIAGAVRLKAPKHKEEQESLPVGAPVPFDPNSLSRR